MKGPSGGFAATTRGQHVCFVADMHDMPSASALVGLARAAAAHRSRRALSAEPRRAAAAPTRAPPNASTLPCARHDRCASGRARAKANQQGRSGSCSPGGIQTPAPVLVARPRAEHERDYVVAVVSSAALPSEHKKLRGVHVWCRSRVQIVRGGCRVVAVDYSRSLAQ